MLLTILLYYIMCAFLCLGLLTLLRATNIKRVDSFHLALAYSAIWPFSLFVFCLGNLLERVLVPGAKRIDDWWQTLGSKAKKVST